ARKGIEAKNSLTAEDALIVEEAFALRLTGIGESEEGEGRQQAQGPGQEGWEGQRGGRDGREGRQDAQQGRQERGQGGRERQGGQEGAPPSAAEDPHRRKAPRTTSSVDKSTLALGEPRRYRDK